MYTLPRQSRLRWLGHIHRMEDGRIPKDLLYGELATWYRDKGRTQLRYKDVCKQDMKALNMDYNNWEALAANRAAWKQELSASLKTGEQALKAISEEMSRKGKESSSSNAPPTDDSVFTCQDCKHHCKSCIRLYSHTRRSVDLTGA